MKNLIILLVIIFAGCKKDEVNMEASSTITSRTKQLKSIVSTLKDSYENYTYENKTLKSYSYSLYSFDNTILDINYDHLNRPTTIKENLIIQARFHHTGNTVSVVICDVNLDSTVYFLNHNGKISKILEYDDFHGPMLIKKRRDFLYTENNLSRINNTEYTGNGKVQNSYSETATYDTESNFFDQCDMNIVLLHELFTDKPNRIFSINSKNNVTSVHSNHRNEPYSRNEQLSFDSDGDILMATYSLQQAGTNSNDVLQYSYQFLN